MNTKQLIEAAAKVAGSQVKLGKLIDVDAPTLIQMKNGTRPCNWRVRGKLRAVLGEDPARAFITAMAEDLEQSEREDEKQAAAGFKAMLSAFPPETDKAPETKKPSSSKATGLDWRNRRDSNPRT